MPDKFPISTAPVPTGNVGKVYGTYITDTEKRAAEANDWLLPKDRVNSATSSVTKKITPLKAPDVSGKTASVTDGVTEKISGITTDATEKVGELTGKFKTVTLPKWPAIGKAGILLGAGPKFVSETVTKYTSIVPKFIPRVPLSVGSVVGAAKLIQSVASANPTDFVKQVMGDAVGGLKDQIASATNIVSDVQGQISDAQNLAQDTVDGALSTVNAAESTASTAISDATSVVSSNISSTVEQTTKNISSVG